MNSEPRYQQLDSQERHNIAMGLEQGLSIRAIARMLGRAASTISREIERNCGGGAYSGRHAHQRCVRRRIHARPAPKLAVGNALFEVVVSLLRLHWSPQQIAAHLAKLHPPGSARRVCHETIYNVIYAQPRGELRREGLWDSGDFIDPAESAD
jgi:transposase, IS30 family